MVAPMEKRQFERFPVHRGSVANINGQHLYSTITDISETGLSFICAPELQHGDKVDLTLEIRQDQETKTIHILVEVVRCLKDDFEHYVGATVKIITEEFKALVQQIQQSRLSLAS